MTNEDSVFAGFNPIAAVIANDLAKSKAELAAYEAGIAGIEAAGAAVPDSMADMVTVTKQRIRQLEAANTSGGFYLTAQLGDEDPTGFGFTHIPADNGADHKFRAFVVDNYGDEMEVRLSSKEYTGVRSGNREARAFLEGALAMIRQEGAVCHTWDVSIDK